MNDLYINREWLVSPRAQRVYLVCAGLTVAFFAIVAAALFLDEPERALLFDSVPAVHLLLAILVRAGLVGFVTLETAMAYFWWNFDRMGSVSKTLGVVLLALLPIGCFFYYLIFYRRGVSATMARAASVS